VEALMDRACVLCGARWYVRRLCAPCYYKQRSAGTLDQFPPLSKRVGDLQLLTTAGITYRQLDYWCRQGYLQPEHLGGSGVFRQWSKAEVRVVHTMGRLVTAGLLPPVAAKVARGEREIAPGIRVVIGRAAHPAR
jgi:hypothetical protein